MRDELQVMEQLLRFARDHDEIRAVVMNGSRVNPDAPQDLFCDYDVVFFVPEPRRFLTDQSWIPYFGELVILQQNDLILHDSEAFIFLMLFSDGVRIDLAFDALTELAYLGEDSLTVVLLDKDRRIPPLPPPSSAGYVPARPTPREFTEAVNEVFWCANNVAKGLWRGELTYAKYMHDLYIRDALLKVLSWYAAMLHDWAVNPGYYGKWLQRYLPEEMWQTCLRTYAGPEEDSNWDALFETLALARQAGMPLAQHLGYPYPLEDDRRTLVYLQRVRALHRDAVSFNGQ